MNSLDDVVNITVTRKTQSVSRAGFGTPLILANHSVFADRAKTYSSLDGLASAGFATDSEVYLAATALLSGTNQVESFVVGRIDDADASLTDSLDAVKGENNDWYALGIVSRAAADILLAAAWVEANSKLFIAVTADADAPTDADDDILSQLDALAYRRTFAFYKKDGAATYPEFRLFGECLPYDAGTLTWAFKTLSGQAVDVLTDDEVSNLEAKNANYYVAIGGVNLFVEGKNSSSFIDLVRGEDWLVARIQENVFSLFVNELKIPYNDRGVALVVSRVQEILDTATVKEILRDDPRAVAVASSKVSEMGTENRAARILEGVSASGEFAGAIHSVKFNLTLSA